MSKRTTSAKRRSWRQASATALVAVAMSACATAPHVPVIDSQLVSQLHKGLTTKQEVVSLFGEPQTALSDVYGDARLTYFEDRPTKQPSTVTIVPVIGLLFLDKDAQTDSDTLVVTLHDDVVEDYFYSRRRLSRSLEARLRK